MRAVRPLKIICAFAAGLLAFPLSQSAAASSLGEAVLEELNFARTDPGRYAQGLRREARRATQARDFSTFAFEDPTAVAEAIDFLERQRPLPPLKPDSRLMAAADAFARTQGPRGQVGHRAADGASLNQRLQRHGLWAGMTAENISYGYDQARDVVRQLIVDSGVPSRGHRHNIFSAGYQAAGVRCAGHRIHGSMCVINFAGAIMSR